MEKKTYIAIDLKSFYASVECVERKLDPLTTNLVVADAERTEKTICLAVSPSLKSHGVPSRPRLFEVIARVNEVNRQRRWSAPKRRLVGSTFNNNILKEDNSLALDYIVAKPRMALYIDYSTRIYGVYLKYFAPEDIHVYSIDEVFIDASGYLKTYKVSARELVMKVIRDVLKTTGITATAGIGTNLYLCKVAMDIVAKHIAPDRNGVRIAELDEISYRRLLWEHRPLTDFWRVGRGYEKKLEAHGMYTMGDIALKSIEDDELLYKLFGVNAELLIDHAWGFEPCGMEHIKSYRPLSNSLSSGQVLHCPYDYVKAKLITREMCDLLVLDLVEKHLVTNQIVLTVGYDCESLTDKNISYSGEVTVDYYGRATPKHAHGTVNLSEYTSSTNEIIKATMELFDRIVNDKLLVRRVNICASNIKDESVRKRDNAPLQMSFFVDYDTVERERQRKEADYEREKREQKAMISIRRRFGNNAILKGMNFEEGATAIDRNLQIGGHKA